MVYRKIFFAFFHFICSVAGFFTLLVAKKLYESLVSSESFDTGKSVLLAFAFLFGIIGVTGQLPALIQQGKISLHEMTLNTG
jgi:hypothetical protein